MCNNDIENYVFPMLTIKDDCQGKADFDGDLAFIESRIYPPNYSNEGKWSARSSIYIRIDRGTKGRLYCEQEFSGDSKREVSQQVKVFTDKVLSEINAKLFPTTGEQHEPADAS